MRGGGDGCASRVGVGGDGVAGGGARGPGRRPRPVGKGPGARGLEARLRGALGWRRPGASAPGRGPRGAVGPLPARGPRGLRAATGACLVVAGCAALVSGVPRLLVALAQPTPVRAGALTPRWTGEAAFVHPGRAVEAPTAGSLLRISGAGLVPSGGRLASLALPAPSPRAWAGSWRRGAAAVPVPAARPLACLRRHCPPSAPAPLAPPRRVLTLAAPQAGWFVPGWDPLAALASAALTDLPPRSVQARPTTAPALGEALPAGAPVGEIGSPWRGDWLLVLPAAAVGAVAPGAAAGMRWAGGRAPMPVRLVGFGPRVGALVVGVFSTRALGGDPGPSARVEATLSLPTARGEVVPASALLPGPRPGWAAVFGRRRAGRPRLWTVRLLARVGAQAVVRGLPARASVFARPGIARLVAGRG